MSNFVNYPIAALGQFHNAAAAAVGGHLPHGHPVRIRGLWNPVQINSPSPAAGLVGVPQRLAPYWILRTTFGVEF